MGGGHCGYPVQEGLPAKRALCDPEQGKEAHPTASFCRELWSAGVSPYRPLPSRTHSSTMPMPPVRVEKANRALAPHRSRRKPPVKLASTLPSVAHMVNHAWPWTRWSGGAVSLTK